MKKLTHALLVGVGACFLGLAGFSTTAHAAPPAEAFGELPLAFDAGISPDGEQIALIINLNGQYFFVSRQVGAAPTDIKGNGLGRGVRPNYVRWVNNDRYFVSFTKMEESDGVPYSAGYIYTRDINEEEGRILVTPNFFRQDNNTIVNWLDDDPNHVLMSLTTRASRNGGSSKTKQLASLQRVARDVWPAIYKVDVKTGKKKLVEKARENVRDWITDPSGNPVVGTAFVDGTFKRSVKNIKNNRWTSHRSYPGLDAETPIFSVLKGGTELVIGDYNGRDTIGLYVYDLEQKKRTRSLFHNDDYDASGVIISTDGETIIGAKYIADKEETKLLGKFGTLLDKMRAKYPGFSVDFVDQTEDGDTILFMLSSPYEPGGLFMYSVGDAEPTMVERRYSRLVSPDMGDVISVKYTARDGQTIPAFITLPPTIKSQADLKSLPFIVLPHGGPYSRDEKRFDYFAQFFATRGYGVMQMNFRGSEGFGKSFEEAGRNNWEVMHQDVEDAARYLLEKGYSDPNRTCVAGWSYGGYAALMGAARDTEGLYDCAISMAGLTDIGAAKRDFEDYREGRARARDFFGESMNSSAVRKANSPVDLASQINVPVFLAHGELDENVRFTQFERMKKALEKADKDGTYVEFENEDHFLSKQANRETFFVEVEKFLNKVNGPSEHMAK